MRKKVTILTLLLLISISGRIFACNCIGKRIVEQEIKHADAVVVGRILSKQIIRLTESTLLKMYPNDTTMRNSPISKRTIARYDFLIKDIYKGEIIKDTLTIFTGLGGGDCGISFEIGKMYIIYGENKIYFGQINNDINFPRAKNTFWTHSCSRTTPYFRDEITEIEKFAKKQKRKTNDK